MLAAVGLFAVDGVVAGGPDAWRKAGLQVRVAERMDPVATARAHAGGEISLLDVRDDDEWQRLSIPGVERRSLWELGDWRPGDGLPVAVVCASGARSAIAASALRGRLPQPVLRVDGGVADVLAALLREPVAL
jgi:rhodanese-related sulfurtransferase